MSSAVRAGSARSALLSVETCHLVSHATTPDVCSVVGILLSPLLGFLNGFVLIAPPVFGDLLIKRIITVRGGHESLDGEEDLRKKVDMLIRKSRQIKYGSNLNMKPFLLRQFLLLTALICKAGDHLFFRMSRQMRPKSSDRVNRQKISINYGLQIW